MFTVYYSTATLICKLLTIFNFLFILNIKNISIKGNNCNDNIHRSGDYI